MIASNPDGLKNMCMTCCTRRLRCFRLWAFIDSKSESFLLRERGICQRLHELSFLM